MLLLVLISVDVVDQFNGKIFLVLSLFLLCLHAAVACGKARNLLKFAKSYATWNFRCRLSSRRLLPAKSMPRGISEVESSASLPPNLCHWNFSSLPPNLCHVNLCNPPPNLCHVEFRRVCRPTKWKVEVGGSAIECFYDDVRTGRTSLLSLTYQ